MRQIITAALQLDGLAVEPKWCLLDIVGFIAGIKTKAVSGYVHGYSCVQGKVVVLGTLTRLYFE